MSLTPVEDNNPLVDKPGEVKVTRFNNSDPEPTLPEEGDQSYPLRRMFHDMDYKSMNNMHKFAREGDNDRLGHLIRHNRSRAAKYVNTLNNEKLAPLHYAARYNYLECVRLLVELTDANVNVCNDEKVTPIHFAARYKRKSQKTKQTNVDTEEMETDGDFAQNTEAMSKIQNEEARQRLLEEESQPTKDNSVILYLVVHGANPNTQDCYGCTPLHYAAMRGNEVAAAQLLTLEGINTEVEDNESMTPLHLACAHNQESIADLLLRRQANLFNCEESGLIPFHIVCGEGNLRLARLLVDIAKESKTLQKMLNAVDNDLSTPLHYAVENGHVEIVRMCLDKGADPNAVTHVGETALHMASHCGSVQLVEMLTAAGASLDVVNKADQTPMHGAAKKNHVDVIQYLTKQGADMESRDVDSYTPLLMAASYGHSETLQLLIEKKCDILATEKENKSVLYLAVEQNYPKAVQTILSDELNRELLNVPDLNSNFPLHIAAKQGRADIVEILLDNTADDDVKNEEEQTPMHLAAKFGRVQIVKILHERSKCNLIVDEDEDSNTPLHLAAGNGFSKVVKQLLDMGADIDARNCNKWTALDAAAANGNFKAAQVLLENDSPVDPMDKSKITPLYLACKNGHSKLVKLLLKKNADVGIRVGGDEIDAGCNPLDAAIDNGHRECALAILNTENWERAMRNHTGPRPGKVNTPMRKLIRKMPDVAEVVFDKCCETNKQSVDSRELSVTYTFEFLEDTYAMWGLSEAQTSDHGSNTLMLSSTNGYGTDLDDGAESETMSVSRAALMGTPGMTYDFNEKLLPGAQWYTKDAKFIQKNHPLMIMVKSEREDLLAHPLVTNLLKIKWNNFGQIVYYVNLSVYLLFLCCLLSYMLIAVSPYSYFLRNKDIAMNKSTCSGVQLYQPLEKLQLGALICKYFVIVLACVGAIKETIQLVMKGKHYFSVENMMEWILYILSFVTVFDFSDCQKNIGIRESWQWQTGAVASFIGIINLVLFIRKVPFFGIFVVMFTDVMWTFIKFLPLFFLFIFAFAFSFFILMSNQVAFYTLPNAIIRTTVMMIGEFDFDDTFNTQWDEDVPNNRMIFYDEVTYIIFVVFLLMMSIITMNLLVGLAVDDIKAVQEKATLKRLAMQVTLALEVEGLVPELFRRQYINRKTTLYPNQSTFFKRIFNLGNDNYMPPDEDDLGQLDNLYRQQKSTNLQVMNIKNKVKTLQSQNENLIHMVSEIMKNLKINVDEEENLEVDEYE